VISTGSAVATFNPGVACDREIEIYKRIEDLLRELSDGREDAKTDMLIQRRKKHDLVIAFDTYLITLHDLNRRLRQSGADNVMLATGETKGSRAQVQKRLSLGSTATGIALCSDALAEGVNLQAASAVAFLDMPTVVRIAEQRIGRIDRMDTHHREIEVFWPNDAEEFALRASDLLLDRMKDVADLLGSNVPLPPHLLSADPEASIRAEEMQRILSELASEAGSEVLRDAFQAVRSLVEGAHRLVPPDVYKTVQRTRAQFRTAVCVLRTEQRWGFYAIAAVGRAAPRWMYVDAGSSAPITDLDGIVARLRERLNQPTEAQLDEHAGELMAEDLDRLQLWEERTLPRRKQRALDLLRTVLDAERQKGAALNPLRRKVIRDILELCPAPSATRKREPTPDLDEVVDLDAVAEWWIELIRPMWQRHLTNTRRRRPARLSDLVVPLTENPPSTEHLLSIFDSEMPLYTIPLARRVTAAIVGIPAGTPV